LRLAQAKSAQDSILTDSWLWWCAPVFPAFQWEAQASPCHEKNVCEIPCQQKNSVQWYIPVISAVAGGIKQEGQDPGWRGLKARPYLQND
jgi:hypothetical protein